MNIREYLEDDYHEIADLFHASVHAINHAAYSFCDLEAWAPSPIDYEYWKNRLALKKPYIAVNPNNKIAAFIELEETGHIDCLYVHPNNQNQGIATQLIKYSIEQAKRKNIGRLFVEASEIAKSLFIANGFHVISENKVQRRGRTLKNHKMELFL